VAGSGLERVECGVQASPPTQVRFGDGRDDVVAVVGASDESLRQVDDVVRPIGSTGRRLRISRRPTGGNGRRPARSTST